MQKLYAATAGCIGFMMLKYKWELQDRMVQHSRLQSLQLNILIAVVSDFESGIRGFMAMSIW